MKLQLKRSNVLVSGGAKEPTAAQLDYGELAINYSAGDAAIFLKDSTNNVIRIAGVGNIADDGLTNVPTSTSPPTSPTPEAGNLWYNSEDGRLYIYYVDDNSSQWVDASPDTWQTTVIPDTTNPAHQAGTLDDRYINTNGDTLTGALLLDNAASVAAPDLAFDGDSNTGIYSPGADSLAITTAGTHRVTVDSSGNVGIGTTSPAKALEILRDSFPCLMLNDGGQYKSYMQLGGNDLEIRGSSGTIEFYTGAADGLSSTERMRIDNSGLLVGTTTSNGAKLKVSDGGAHEFAFFPDDSGVNSLVNYNRSGGAYVDMSIAAKEVSFKTGTSPTEKMRIDSSGNVGIGTSSQSHGLLTLSQSASSAFNALVIQQGNTGSAATDGLHIGIDSAVDAYIMHKESRALAFGTANTERMRIDSSGLVNVTGGIQVTQNVTPTTGSGVEIFKPTSTAGQMQAFDRSGSAWMDLILKGNTQQFHANGSERMRIDSLGQLLLGTTAAGFGNAADNLTIADNGNCGMTIRSASAYAGSLYFADGTSGSANYAGFIDYQHSVDALRFGTGGGQERMRIDKLGQSANRHYITAQCK